MASQVADVFAARRSCRGFKKSPVAKARLEELFALAQRAPSWCNIQPWHITVTSPEKTRELSSAIIAHVESNPPAPDIPFPGPYPEPYQLRRKACGIALYSSMGVTRDDKEGRKRAWLRNYQCFDAPHLAIVTRARDLGEYATLDIGVWLGYLLVAAESMGIATCPMASLAEHPAPFREHLDIPDGRVILLGIALGLADDSVPANGCETTREELSNSVRFA